MPPEEQVVGGATEQVEPVGMDMEAAVADIADALSVPPEPEEEEAAVEGDEKGEERALAAEAAKVAAPAPVLDPRDAPPDTWRKEAKEAWTTVSPLVKEELRKREADISNYVERVKQPISIGERFTEIITPYLPLFEKSGVDPWQNVQAMLQAQERLLFGSPEEKLAMFQSLAQQSGIKFDQGQLSAPPDATVQYVRQLEQRLAQLEGGVKQVTSTMQEARTAELHEGVVAFAQDKETHPYFYEVADKITHFIRTGAAPNLEDAYQMAIMADPIIKAKVIDAEATRVVSAKTAAEVDRAAKARKAGKVNVRTTTRGKTGQPPGSIDDTLKDALAEIHARP